MFRVFGKLKRHDRQDRAAEKLANLAIIVIGERCVTWLGRVVTLANMMICLVMFTFVTVTSVTVTAVGVGLAVAINRRMRRFAQRMHVYVRRAREHDRKQIRPGGEQLRRSIDGWASHDE